MRKIFFLLCVSLCCFGEWTNTQITNISQDVYSIDTNTELTNTMLSLSLYNPMDYRPSIISPETDDNLHINRGDGRDWFDSWELTDNNAELYEIDELHLGDRVFRSAYGRNWDDTHNLGRFQDIFTDPYISDLTESNVVGEQFGALHVDDQKVGDSRINSKTDMASNLVNSFQAIAQSYLNYTYNGEPLFEIDLEPIGLFYERVKESLPGYEIPSAPTNAFMGKKITCTLVPAQGTLLYRIHETATQYRTLITYMMWGFLVFEIFNMVVAYANK